MIDLDKIKQDAKAIFGAFLEDEIAALAETASSCLSNSNFVELGCYCGRSSSILGQIARENNCDFTCIDIFNEFPPGINTSAGVKEYFQQNMNLVNAKYTLLNIPFQEAGKIYKKDIDLLFIDGNHEYISVKQDIADWLPKVKTGGWVLFHDYEGPLVGVKQAVNEVTNLEHIQVVQSLLITKKI